MKNISSYSINNIKSTRCVLIGACVDIWSNMIYIVKLSLYSGLKNNNCNYGCLCILRLRVMAFWMCFLCLFCEIFILVHSITHSLFIISSCNFIGMCIEPRHEISNNVVCVTSKASDQPAHTCSLIRAFASRLKILWMFSYWLNINWLFYS